MAYIQYLIGLYISNYLGESQCLVWDLPALLLTLCNGSREGGGILVATQPRNDDGLLDYATIRKLSRLMMLRLVPEVRKGTHGRVKQFRMETCRRMKITSNRALYIHADGEIFSGFNTDIHSLSIEVVPDAIQIARWG